MEKQKKKDYPHEILTGFGKLNITITEQDEKPFQVLIVPENVNNFFIMSVTMAIGNLISLILRQGVAMEEIVGQLKGIQDGSPVFKEGEPVILSIPDAVAHVMDRHQKKRVGSRV